MLKSYKHTVAACCVGYITQAIINNFAPLLFITFHTSYGISLRLIGLLVAVNFGTQLFIDLFAAKFADKIGYRISIMAAHVFAALGLVGLAVLPELLSNAFAGLVIAVILYGIGGGMVETLVSPIVEACPTNKKSSFMSFLHSFYCWGSVVVILVSTLFFYLFGTSIWKITAVCWAAVPVLNCVYFAFVPISELAEDGERMSVFGLLRTKMFWIFALLMMCAGAAELSISQWASAFAESGLKVPKAVGDVAGPCMFAVCMGVSRLIHAKFGHRFDLKKYIGFCSVLCVGGYLISALVPVSAIALVGCGICGISVGVMWPGVFSLASATCPKGGTALFALLALAGDCGCTVGPSLVGFVSSALGNDLHKGLLVAVIFPVLLVFGLFLLIIVQKKHRQTFSSGEPLFSKQDKNQNV